MVEKLAKKFGIGTHRKFRLFTRGVLTVIIAISGYALAILLQMTFYWWSTLPFGILFLATFLEFVLADSLAEKYYPYETEKKLELLEQSLGVKAINQLSEKLKSIIQQFKACDNEQISGTVHILVELASTNESKTRTGLLQLTDYVGPHKGRKGRITTLSKGIIGRCVRTNVTQYANFSDKTEYYDRMSAEFGFLRKEAESHSTIARSYLAEPIFVKRDNETVIVGVLYFFTTETQVFPVAADEVNLKAEADNLVYILKTGSIV